MRATQTELASVLVHRKSFVVTTEHRRQAIDIRPQVEVAVQSAAAQSGVVIVNCLHTTCSVIVAESTREESEPLHLLSRFIRDSEPYRHNDLRWSDCERGNAAAHLRASLLGPGVTIGISRGRLALDQSQSILLAEWDGPRSRTVDIQVLGA